MEISRRLDYALRMLCEVAREQEGGVVSVRKVAEASGIPYSFARTIQHELVRCGLLVTTRGPHGGMCLADDPRATTLLDVVERIEGPVCVFGGEYAASDRPDELGKLWHGLKTQTERYLSSVTIYQLAVEGLVPAASDDLNYELVSLASQEQVLA